MLLCIAVVLCAITAVVLYSPAPEVGVNVLIVLLGGGGLAARAEDDDLIVLERRSPPPSRRVGARPLCACTLRRDHQFAAESKMRRSDVSDGDVSYPQFITTFRENSGAIGLMGYTVRSGSEPIAVQRIMPALRFDVWGRHFTGRVPGRTSPAPFE